MCASAWARGLMFLTAECELSQCSYCTWLKVNIPNKKVCYSIRQRYWRIKLSNKTTVYKYSVAELKWNYLLKLWNWPNLLWIRRESPQLVMHLESCLYFSYIQRQLPQLVMHLKRVASTCYASEESCPNLICSRSELPELVMYLKRVALTFYVSRESCLIFYASGEMP